MVESLAIALSGDRYDFAILGAGAIGSIAGAHLAAAGHSVVLLAREPRATGLERDGLRITGLANLAVRLPVLRHPADLKRAEVLIVAIKAPGTLAVIREFAPGAIGTAFSLQNGPGKTPLLAEVFGTASVLGALADTSGELLRGGEVLFTRNVNILLGEIDGRASERTERLAFSIDAAGVRAAAVTHIMSHEWSKFCAWAGLMTMSIATRAPTPNFLCNDDSATVIVRLVRELGTLSRALGYELTDRSVLPVATICAVTESEGIDAVKQRGRAILADAPTHRMSSLQDLEAGKPLEIDETLGYSRAMALKLGLNLPLLDSVFHLSRAIDRSRP